MSASSEGKSTAPASPTVSDASSFSPYRRRYTQQTRRQMWERRLGQSPRGSGFGTSIRNGKTTNPTEKPLQDSAAPTLTQSDLTSCIDSKLSLVQRRAGAFGGSVNEKKSPDGAHRSSEPAFKKSSFVLKEQDGPITSPSDIDDEKKSHFSGGSTTVTTESSTTQPHLGAYATLSDDPSCQSHIEEDQDDSSSHDTVRMTPRKPQHTDETHDKQEIVRRNVEDVRYYRIVYKGVVSLLSDANPKSQRSGAYLSYGEIFMSRDEVEVDESVASSLQSRSPSAQPYTRHVPRSPVHNENDPRTPFPPLSPPRSLVSHSGSVSSLETLRTTSTALYSQNLALSKDTTAEETPRLAIRVDEVLTGGYARDGTDHERKNQNTMKTPKRSNAQLANVAGPSPLPFIEPVMFPRTQDGDSGIQQTSPSTDGNFGFVFNMKRNVQIVEPVSQPPMCQSGLFLYKVTSSSPLPILTGPCVDAPTTRAMLLPGTVHEVCLKVIPSHDDDEMMFLRLCHRRGWIAERRISHVAGKNKLRSIPAVREVTDDASGGIPCDGSTSSLSTVSVASVFTNSSLRRRHRPPRRKRDKGKNSQQTARTPTRKPPSPIPRKLVSPNSNISLLSDESSFDQHGFQGLPTDTEGSPVREPEHEVAPSPTVFLMLVNAPRGLKILDAPHFQVSNLIHGTDTMGGRSDGMTQGIKKSNSSIFKTMGGSKTTPSPTATTNPAVFDGKMRTLPRGALFEASSRMETSASSFNQGSGLIKLFDNSGWAIVPNQDELDTQYRHYHGGVTSIKEGEATRAYEEVGNAILLSSKDETPAAPETSSMWLRIVARNGTLVSCPPPSPVLQNDVHTSPTSSTGGGSSVVSGAGSNVGNMTSQDSDVASSVGSAFLDAVFKTPRKKEPDRDGERYVDRVVPNKRDEVKLVDSVVPCGMCVEVEKWVTYPDVNQDYIRLVGGQGWFPRHFGGRPCAVPVERPDVRFGSFWFRVKTTRGIKVRAGPSRRASSIRSDDGVFFRFECGEYLRACEVMTVIDPSAGTETFAKLYRNRHVQMTHHGGEKQDYRVFDSLTAQAEWVQVHSNDQLYLEECGAAPHIQRHPEGWRYNAVHESGIGVRKGPSFEAELTGAVLLGGESILVNERVAGPNERITWLRLMNGNGWVHDIGQDGSIMMIAHSLHHRSPARGLSRPVKAPRPPKDDAAYHTLIARLFHGDASERNAKKSYRK